MRTIVLLLTYYSSALYGLANPVFGLFFFIHITIFRPESLVWGNRAFGRLHLTTALFILISYLIHGTNNQHQVDGNHQKKNLAILLGFTVWVIIVSLLAEISVELSLIKSIEVIKIFVLCFLFAKLITTESRIKIYAWVSSISFGMLSLWGFQQGLAGNPRLDTLWPGGSNYVAAQLALMAPFVLAKAFDTSLFLKYRLIFFGCTLAIVLCSIYTQSRGGFLGLGVGLFVFMLRMKYRVKALMGVILVAVLVFPWLPATFSDRIDSVLAAEGEQDISAASRPVLWRIALRIWQDHPFAGVGLENFSPVKETYVDKVSDIVPSQEMFGRIFNQQRYTHGLYPGMMVETGLVGISLFLLLLYRNVFCRFPPSLVYLESQHSLYLQVQGAQAGLLGFAVAALFGDFQYLEMLYLQLFFIGAIRSYADSLVSSINIDQSCAPASLVAAQS